MTVEREQRTTDEAWLERRRAFLNASQGAATDDLHPWITRLELWNTLRGFEVPKPDNAMMLRGRDLEEPGAIGVQRAKPGWRIWNPNEYLFDRATRIGCTPDRYATDEKGRLIVIQIKVVAAPTFKRNWDDNLIPPYVLWQNQHEINLCGAYAGLVAALEIDAYTHNLHLYEVPQHDKAWQYMLSRYAWMWQHVDAGTEPPRNYARDGALLAMMFPHAKTGSVVDLRADNRIQFLCSERERLSEAMKAAKEERDAVDAEIIDKMKDNEAALVRGWRLTYKEQHRREHMVKATSFRVIRCVKEETVG